MKTIFNTIRNEITSTLKYPKIDPIHHLLENAILNNISPVKIYGSLDTPTTASEIKKILDIEYNKNNFFIFDESGHNGDWSIVEMNSIESVEEYILDGGGYLNMFTTTLIVIRHDKVLRFKVYECVNEEKQYVTDFEEVTDEGNLFVEWI